MGKLLIARCPFTTLPGLVKTYSTNQDLRPVKGHPKEVVQVKPREAKGSQGKPDTIDRLKNLDEHGWDVHWIHAVGFEGGEAQSSLGANCFWATRGLAGNLKFVKLKTTFQGGTQGFLSNRWI